MLNRARPGRNCRTGPLDGADGGNWRSNRAARSTRYHGAHIPCYRFRELRVDNGLRRVAPCRASDMEIVSGRGDNSCYHEGRLKYCHNVLGIKSFYASTDSPLPAGVRQARMEFAYDGGGFGKGGAGTLYVDGKKVGEGRVGRHAPFQLLDGRDDGQRTWH